MYDTCIEIETVGDLLKAIRELPKDMPVLCTGDEECYLYIEHGNCCSFDIYDYLIEEDEEDFEEEED